MNHEFDKINEVCSTGYLKNKLHEAETLKTDIETVLFERVYICHNIDLVHFFNLDFFFSESVST